MQLLLTLGLCLVALAMMIGVFWVRNKTLRQFLIPVCLLFGSLFLFGGIFLVRYAFRDSELEAFNQRIGEYLQETKGDEVEQKPRVVGKILPVDVRLRKVSHLYYDLPEALQPRNPEEVGTVVWLEWGKSKVGTYEGGDAAYVSTCQITVIDKKEWRVICQENVSGPSPPLKKKASDSGEGTPATREVIKFLTDLQRQ